MVVIASPDMTPHPSEPESCIQILAQQITYDCAASCITQYEALSLLVET